MLIKLAEKMREPFAQQSTTVQQERWGYRRHPFGRPQLHLLQASNGVGTQKAIKGANRPQRVNKCRPIARRFEREERASSDPPDPGDGGLHHPVPSARGIGEARGELLRWSQVEKMLSCGGDVGDGERAPLEDRSQLRIRGPILPVHLCDFQHGTHIAYFADADHLFRTKSISRFAPCRSPGSVDVDQG